MAARSYFVSVLKRWKFVNSLFFFTSLISFRLVGFHFLFAMGFFVSVVFAHNIPLISRDVHDKSHLIVRYLHALNSYECKYCCVFCFCLYLSISRCVCVWMCLQATSNRLNLQHATHYIATLATITTKKMNLSSTMCIRFVYIMWYCGCKACTNLVKSLPDQRSTNLSIQRAS